MRVISFAVIALLAALIAAGCNGGEQGGRGAAASAVDKPKDPAVEIVDFELKDLEGKTVRSADVRAGKVLVLKFGATWCPPCNDQIPHLNKVVETYGDKVAVVDVDVREKAAKVKPHTKSHGVKYLVLLDESGAIGARYSVRGIPTVLVAGKDGRIAYRGHFTSFDALKQKIDPLLEKQ